MVLENKKVDEHKLTHLSAKLIVTNSDIDKLFWAMHQSVMTKTKTSISEDLIIKTVAAKA